MSCPLVPPRSRAPSAAAPPAGVRPGGPPRSPPPPPLPLHPSHPHSHPHPHRHPLPAPSTAGRPPSLPPRAWPQGQAMAAAAAGAPPPGMDSGNALPLHGGGPPQPYHRALARRERWWGGEIGGVVVQAPALARMHVTNWQARRAPEPAVKCGCGVVWGGGRGSCLCDLCLPPSKREEDGDVGPRDRGECGASGKCAVRERARVWPSAVQPHSRVSCRVVPVARAAAATLPSGVWQPHGMK